MNSLRPRVIPCLQIDQRSLVKTRSFKDPLYLGDPVNAVRIFNDLEADELIVVDISATRRGVGPDFEFIEEFASECFMPLAYGGGITEIGQVRRLFDLGVEKVVLNSVTNLADFVAASAATFGRQSIVVSVDVRRSLLGRYEVCTHSGTRRTKRDPRHYAADMQVAGAGEIFLQSIDREGSRSGYDLDLIRSVCGAVNVPVVACGGAGGLPDLRAAMLEGGAAAVSAGTMFALHGKHRAPLISYPRPAEVAALLS